MNHDKLGFDRDMPGVTGMGVEVVTPAQEQLAELKDRANRHMETADNMRAMLDTLPGELDEHLGDFITDANAPVVDTPETHEEAVIADEAGALAVMQDGGLSRTATVLGQQPDETLGEALREIAISEGDDAAEEVTRRIDEATKIVTYDDVIDKLTPGMRELAEIYGNSGHLEVLPNAPIPEVFGALDKKLRDATYPFDESLDAEFLNLCEDAKKQFYDAAATNPQGADRMITALHAAYVAIEKSQLVSMQDLLKEYQGEALSQKEIDARVQHTVLTGRALNRLLQQLPVESAKAIRTLPESQRKNFDKICDQYLSRELPVYAHNNETVGDIAAENELFRAHLEGFASLTEKFQAIEGGEIPVPENGHPTKLDTLVDLLEDGTTNEQYQSWSNEFLRKELHLPPTISSEMLVAAMGRSRMGEYTPTTNGSKLFAEMEQIQKSVEALGIEDVTKLRDKCGIVNIHQLSEEQARRMIQFADGDPKLEETLADKEVCVIVRDATADWNGALSGINHDFETTDGATLIFEVSDLGNPNQLRSFTTALQRQGIRASALVVAGHGSPGKIQMGSTYLSFRHEYVARGEHLPDEAGFDAILKRMKPDRDGNCSVIFASCSQAANIGEEFDSSLTRMAQLAHEAQPNATFHTYGIEKPGSVRPNTFNGGDLTDGHGQYIEHVIAPASGKTYQLGRYKEVALPMFSKPQADERIAA